MVHSVMLTELLWSDFHRAAVCGGFTGFTLSVRPSVRTLIRLSVTFCFLNILKSHCWILIKPCKHVYICNTNTLNKKVRTRGQFYKSYFPL